MSSLPLPVRVAAGLAAAAVEQTRRLPRSLVGLPVTLASQALQASMRLQQEVTQLAIKGDDVLDSWHAPEEQPSWATFDEDEDVVVRPRKDFVARESSARDFVASEEPVSGEPRPAGEPGGSADVVPTEAVPSDYDRLTLPQLRGKLRGFSADDLEQLLAYERAHARRAEFLRMLSNRLDRVRTSSGEL